MVKVGPSLLFHVADRREGGSRGQGRLIAQRTARAASSGAAHAALRLDTLLLPCVSCCLQPRSRAASSLQQSPLCPRQCRSQRGASELRQVSKVEGRVMVSIFQQKRPPGQGLLLCPESCSFCFPNPSPCTPIPPTVSTTGRKGSHRKVYNRLAGLHVPRTVHCPPALRQQTDEQSREGRWILSGTESFLSGRKVVHQASRGLQREELGRQASP